MNKLTTPKTGSETGPEVNCEVFFTGAEKSINSGLREKLGTLPNLSFLALEQIDLVLAQQPSRHVVFVFTDVVEYISRALSQDIAPGKALATWLRETNALLRIFMRHRKQGSVVGMSEALADPHRFLAALAQRSVFMPAELPDISPYIYQTEASLPLQSIARLTAERSSQACLLQQKLEGLSIILAKTKPSPPDMDLLFENQQKADNTLILLKETLVERDRHFNEVKRLTLELHTKTNDAADMSALLIGQLRDLEQKTERSTTELAMSREAQASLETEVGKIYASKSWKVTEPLRAFRRLFRA